MPLFTSSALCLIIFFYTLTGVLHAHGLGESTVVKAWGRSKSIKNIAEKVSKNREIVSYTFKKNRCTSGYVQSSGKSQSNCSISIGFDNPFGANNDDLSCTPAQEFYLPVEKKWVPACQLKVDDILQSDLVGLIAITRINLVEDPITVYSLEIDKHHNLFVGKYFVLTHNMALPWACSAGLSISFGAGGGAAAGGKAGSCFGPTGIVTGIVVGGILGWAIETYINSDKVHNYESIFDTGAIDALLKGKTSSRNSNPNKPTSSIGINNGPNIGPEKDPQDNNRIINSVTKGAFFKALTDQYEHLRDGVYRLKDRAVGLLEGKAHYLQWDHLHNDVEVYSRSRIHIGSIDPKTLQLYKGPQSHKFPF